MRWTSMGRRGVAALLCAAALAACEDELPTATGEDRFPQGLTPTTLEILLPASEFLLADTVYDDFTRPSDASFLLVAEDFGGQLDAHVVARLTGFPDSVSYVAGGTTHTDSVFRYTGGRVVTLVSNSRSAAAGTARLQLWALDQPWDSATVTWDTAAAPAAGLERWRVPGGTPGRLLGEALWTPGDTAQVDSVRWTVDSLAVSQMAAEGFPGLLVTSSTPGSRVQMSRLALEATIRPTSADTVLTRIVSGGPQEFVYTPAPPPPGQGTYRVGGLTSARTQLRLDLTQTLPGCPPEGGACVPVQLRDVTLNRATLLLEPLEVPAGYRPVGLAPLYVRRVVETGLGRLAPLAETFAADTISAGLFAPPAGGEAAVDLTGVIATALQADTLRSDTLTTTVALLGETGEPPFGYLWFAAEPRLRIVYTLPLRPTLP